MKNNGKIKVAVICGKVMQCFLFKGANKNKRETEIIDSPEEKGEATAEHVKNKKRNNYNLI